MTVAEILRKYLSIIEKYDPTDDSEYVEICEAILKAYHTYDAELDASFAEYAIPCINDQLAQKDRAPIKVSCLVFRR